MKKILIQTMIFGLLSVSAIAAESSAEIEPTQADLITGLVDSLGWSFGLPDDPEIDDYITILKGRRSWRFEIEDIYIPSAEAPLLPKETLSFGPFSGQFWHRAPAREITPDFEFLVPLPGSYELKAALTGPGYEIAYNGSTRQADGERNFSIVSFGTLDMPAGINRLQITVPPRAGIDYLLLVAPPLQEISPRSGWKPDEKLTVDDLAVTVSKTLRLQSLLEPEDDTIVIEAEEAPIPDHAQLSSDRYQGPMQGTWIKSGMRPAPFSHLFAIDQPGIYDLDLNILARTDVTGYVNSRDFFRITPKPYFSIVRAGSFYFEQGINQIDIDLPPRGGLDRIILQPRKSTADDFIRLTGLRTGTAPTKRQLDLVLQLLAAIGPGR